MLVSADPMFLILQANNYFDIGDLKMAELCYRRAYYMMPNRLYPLYKLMRLYACIPSRKPEALAMARRVMAFPVKVVSPATDGMKKEAERIVAE